MRSAHKVPHMHTSAPTLPRERAGRDSLVRLFLDTSHSLAPPTGSTVLFDHDADDPNVMCVERFVQFVWGEAAMAAWYEEHAVHQGNIHLKAPRHTPCAHIP